MSRFAAVLVATICWSIPGQAQSEASYSCGPFLLQPGTQQMTVVIDHETPVQATLSYRRADGQGQQIRQQRAEADRHHIFALDGLEPDTRYTYRVHGDGLDSGERQFRTLPEAPSAYRFIGVGDVRSRPQVWERVAGRIYEQEKDALFIVGTGDYPADGRQYSQWIGQFFDPARDLLAALPIWPSIGNHERTRLCQRAAPRR